MALLRKKIDKPKSTLGSALFKFDEILNNYLKVFFNKLIIKKRLNIKWAENLLLKSFNTFDDILENISTDNFKTDYRSDKIRFLVIDIINKVKEHLNILKSKNFIIEQSDTKSAEFFKNILELRKIISKKMKDIESDYF